MDHLEIKQSALKTLLSTEGQKSKLSAAAVSHLSTQQYHPVWVLNTVFIKIIAVSLLNHLTQTVLWHPTDRPYICPVEVYSEH